MKNVFALSNCDEKDMMKLMKAFKYMRTSEIDDPPELQGLIW